MTEIMKAKDGQEVVTQDSHDVTPAITPMQMLQIAVDKGADLDQLQKLMDLQDRWERNQAKKAFDAALAAFKAEPPTIIKDKHVNFTTSKGRTEYDHATLAQVCAVIGSALSAHGLSHRWRTEQPEPGAVRVTCILSHIQGHSEETTLQAAPDDSGGKNSIQAIGSAVTYLQRYSLLAAVGLAAADQDDDGGGFTETISAEQKDQIVALMRETEADTSRFLAYLGTPTLDELPAKKFDTAMAALRQKQQQKG